VSFQLPLDLFCRSLKEILRREVFSQLQIKRFLHLILIAAYAFSQERLHAGCLDPILRTAEIPSLPADGLRIQQHADHIKYSRHHLVYSARFASAEVTSSFVIVICSVTSSKS